MFERFGRDPDPEPPQSKLLLPGDPGFEAEVFTLLGDHGDVSVVSLDIGSLFDPDVDTDSDRPFFNDRKAGDIFSSVKAATEYADEQNVSAVVFIDKSARPMWVGFKEYWKSTHEKDEPSPNIFFVEPDGFIKMESQSQEEMKEKMETDHPFLAQHAGDSVLVVDTCIHTGRIAGSVLNLMEKYGFEDVKFAVAHDGRNRSSIQPDKVLLTSGPDHGCYPFGRVGYVTEPDHTPDHLYAARWSQEERNPFRIRKLRDEIRTIIRDYLEYDSIAE